MKSYKAVHIYYFRTPPFPDLATGLKPRGPGDNSSRDRSAPNFNICSKLSKQHEERLRNYFFSTGIDRWYESLKDDTFATEFIRITKEDGLAILSYRKALCKNNLSSYSHTTSVQTFEVPDQLRGLQTRLPRGWCLHEAYDQVAKRLGCGYCQGPLVLLAEVMTHSLRVRTGEEAIHLLMFSARWVDIHQWAEFHGFVWEGRLTSVGQYNHPLYFPLLVERRERIKTDLEMFFATVKDRIPLERYTVDFAWTEDRVYIIEVNTFDGEFNASTGLWNWEEVREHMMKGPLELRIREAEQDSKVLVSIIEPEWKAVVFSSAMAVIETVTSLVSKCQLGVICLWLDQYQDLAPKEEKGGHDGKSQQYNHSALNFDILGAPIGDEDFCASFIKKRWLSACELLSLLPKLCDPQLSLGILRQCASFCKLAHLVRCTLPTPAVLELFAIF
eukprot:Em0001g1538a